MTPWARTMADGILLDTCAAIFLMEDKPIAGAGREALYAAGRGRGVFISPVTAWEIGQLSRPGRATSMIFKPTPKAWFARLMEFRAIAAAPFTIDIALETAILPEDIHPDPADRMLIATARVLDIALLTRDRKILGYARSGHLRAVAC